MLHAFNSDTGAEMWAYVPKIVMPNLYKLADQNYGSVSAPHQYYVDGSPEVMDIYVAVAANNLTAGWHTIMVGGLGDGGRGFYALDVTDPAHPKALWEICDSALCAINDPDMGLSYGNPVITKRSSDNKWVVLLSSGYNNAGSGKGTMYTLDAVTGAILYKTTTGAATNPPSGLAKLSPWVDNINTNFTTRFIYSGDLNGDIWRFDLGAVGTSSAPTVTRVASLRDSTGAGQSVTTRIELGDPLNTTTNSLGGTGNPALFVATGRYLGLSDLSNVQVQSVYAFKDDLSKTTSTTPSGYIGDPRSPNAGFSPFVKQYIYEIGSGVNVTTRTTSTYAVDWSTKTGWYADFVVSDPATNLPVTPSVSPGERVNIDPLLLNGSLIVVTSIPDTSACTIGGTSWLYSFNFLTGQYVATTDNLTHVVGRKVGSALTAGIVVFTLPSGKIKAVVTLSDSQQITEDPILVGGGSTKRTSWRELTQ
jgi:type IV pilus assembly protein PilY1